MADIGEIQLDTVGEPLSDDGRIRVTEASNGLPANATPELLAQLAEDARQFPEARDIIREAGALAELVKLAGNEAGDVVVRSAAIKVLFQASIESSQNPAVIANAGGVDVLSAAAAQGGPFSTESRVDAVGVLFNVTSFANDASEPIADEAVVRNVVDLLTSDQVDDDGKAWAAGTLQNLSGGHPAHRGIIGDTPDAITTLLGMAAAPTTNLDTRRIVVAALYNLTIDNGFNQNVILENGGVKTLVYLLKQGAMAVAPAEPAEAAAAAGAGGGAGEAPELEVGVVTMAYAAGALQNLAYDREDRQKEIFTEGGLSSILELLAVGVPVGSGPDGAPADAVEEETILSFYELRTNAAGALFNITGGHNRDVDEFVRSSGRLGAVVALLESGDVDTVTNAAGALFNITCELEENKRAVGDAGGVLLLTAALNAMDVEAVAWCCGALFNLSSRQDLADAITEAGAVPALVDFIEGSEDGRIAAWSAGILNNIATSSAENSAVIVDEGALEPLVTLATETDEVDGSVTEIATFSGDCLRTLAMRNKAWRRQIIDLGGAEVVDASLFEVCCGC